MIEKLRDPEFREALPFALAGLAIGVVEVYVKPVAHSLIESLGHIAGNWKV